MRHTQRQPVRGVRRRARRIRHPATGRRPWAGGMGSGIAGGLASGLAVGAGVVAGEELAHHFLDGGRATAV